MSAIVEQHGASVRVRVHAQPRASRTEVLGAHGDALRVRIAAPPVDGAANAELIRFIAKQLGIPRSAVRVASGDTGRAKVLEIDGMDVERVQRALLG
ncbi:MAG TPA: DUF167 family protein [Longimicrobiales bacterium]